MMTKITIIKKNVHHGSQQFKLIYHLLVKDGIHYGIRVDCYYGNITESEHIWIGESRQYALRLLYLFAKETVFPVALRETFENL